MIDLVKSSAQKSCFGADKLPFSAQRVGTHKKATTHILFAFLRLFFIYSQ